MEATLDPNSTQTSASFLNHAFVPEANAELCLDVIVNHNNTSLLSGDAVSQDIPESKIRKPEQDLQIIWKNVKFSLPIKTGFLGLKSEGKKQILHPMSGILSSGSVMALMGPSGAGKTTLLNIISGIITKDVSGQVFIAGSDCEKRTIRIGFVPQVEQLLMEFTVEETVMFASRLNNGSFGIRDHEEVVEQTLKNLNIHDKKDDKLKVLSGGQLKRTSIAVEIVSNPAILMLDEPTTGLDSDNAETVVRLLKNLTKTDTRDAPAIIATIHQPSTDTFMLFDRIYLLSRNGHHIFSGAPSQVMDYFSGFGFTHKKYTNPAEYIIEIANAKYGDDKFAIMSQAANETELKEILELTSERTNLQDVKSKAQIPPLEQFKLIFWRNFLSFFVKSPIGLMLMMSHLIFCAAVVHMTDTLPGDDDGCWPSLKNYTLINNHSTFSGTTNEKIWNIDIIGLMHRTTEHSMFVIVFVVYFNFVSLMVAITFYSREVRAIEREISNHWYSINCYFVAKISCNLFHLILTTTPAVAYMYFGGGFPANDWWRFGLLLLIFLMISYISESRATFFVIIFHGHPILPMLGISIVTFTMILTSGIHADVELLQDFVQKFSNISDLKFAFDAILISLFGLDICKPTDDFVSNNLLAKRNFTSSVSKLWSVFDITKDDGKKFSLLLGLDERFMDPVIDAIKRTVGPYVPNADDGDLESSYFMHVFDLDQENIYRDITILTGHIIVIHILILIALRSMSRGNKL